MRLTLVAMAVAALSLAFAWRQGRDTAGLDFFQFWAGAQIAHRPETSNLYSPLTRVTTYQAFRERAAKESENMALVAGMRNEFEFFSTPFLYAVFGVFSGDYDRDLLAYRIASLAAFAGGVLLLARAVGIGWTPALWLLAFTLTLFQPLKSEIRVANVNSLQLLMVAAASWLLARAERWNWIAGGALLGLVAAFKPNIAIVVPLLVVDRAVRRERERLVAEGAGAAAGVAIAVVVSSVWFRSFEAWMQWLRAARGLAQTLLPLDSGNVAPALAIARVLGSRASAVMAVVSFLAIAIVLWRRARSRDDEATLVIGLGLLVYLLAATLVWLHYLVLALPLAIALLVDHSAVRRALALLALTLVGSDIWTTIFSVRTAAGEVAILWTGLGLLAVLAGWRLLARSGSLSAP